MSNILNHPFKVEMWLVCAANKAASMLGCGTVFTYVEVHKRQRGLIFKQHSSHLHEDLQQLDAAAQEGRHGFVSHSHVLLATTTTRKNMVKESASKLHCTSSDGGHQKTNVPVDTDDL